MLASGAPSSVPLAMRYENSVTFRGEIHLYNSLKEPGRSGIRTATIVSLESARSDTNRRRSKSMFAPDEMATRVCPGLSANRQYFVSPAIDKAPAGSNTVRVSENPSLMAAQISSVVTVIISSQTSCEILKVLVPTIFTAAPSAKSPTVSKGVTFPARSDAVIPAASSASTPMTLMLGFRDLMYNPTPDNRPPPPTQTKIASIFSAVACFMISMPMVPWPAITNGSSNG
mmetsp:Transcript_5660/g.13472  ORF Transcript_5660/g.13472 Transcript_5660/m.13472 type:complete len:229 (+) Transcript_5660:483-1169(+)